LTLIKELYLKSNWNLDTNKVINNSLNTIYTYKTVTQYYPSLSDGYPLTERCLYPGG